VTHRVISRNMKPSMATALATLMSRPSVELVFHRTPVDRLARLEQALGPGSPRLLIKRDDLLTFGLGGNKVRKLQLIAAEAGRAGADTLVTCGAVQSNHARVTAATGSALGWRVVLVLNGSRPDVPTGNLRHDLLFAADVRFVASRDDRAAAMAEVADAVRLAGGVPFVIPLGGSTPTGAMGMARAVAELSADGVKPDVIVHASSSAGTQAGLVAGCALFGLKTRVVGISVDEPAAALATTVEDLIGRMALALGGRAESLLGPHGVHVDDSQAGPGYGIPTEASREASILIARTEGIVLDDVYTSKAMAGLIAKIRSGEFTSDQTILFWHTGGLIG
jgi:1-aminocyclopropane-1-carboxylate deaminase/D-cysteine desulfhydrase-like pyridoxal-dependent ACC family enzyme